MTGAAQRTGPLPAVQDTAGLAERHARIAAKMEAFLDRLLDGPGTPEALIAEAYNLADQAAALRVEYEAETRRRYAYAELEEAARRRMEAAAAMVPEARRGHRKDRQPPLMRVLRGGVAAFAAAGAWAGLRRFGGHAVRGHLVKVAAVTVIAGGATAGVAATVIIHAQNTPDIGAVPPAAVVQAPDVDQPPVSRLIAATAARRKHPVVLPVPAAPPPFVSSQPVSPASSSPASVPSLSWSPSPQPPPSPGTLEVTDGLGNPVSQVDVSAGQPVTVTLTATGGPADWDADTSSPDVTLTAAWGDGTPLPRLQGRLWPGQTVTVTIIPAVSQDGAEQASVTVADGVGITVTLIDAPAAVPTPESS
jgi:hypothetical protein